MIVCVLLADRLAECVDGGVDTGVNRHGQVLHFERNVAVVAHHAAGLCLWFSREISGGVSMDQFSEVV